MSANASKPPMNPQTGSRGNQRAVDATPNNIAFYHALCQHLSVTVDWLFFGDTRGLSAEMMEKLTSLDLK